MGVLLQAFYKTRPNNAVPSPVDGGHVSMYWWDHLAQQCGDLARAGFTALWLPPPHKADGGSRRTVDGYGMFDDYDLGSKNQMGSVTTRYGTREQLGRLAAVSRSVGLDVYFDMVLHQRIGDPGNFLFRYNNASGTAAAGRFPKNPKNFFPNVPRDPQLGGPVADDIGFGRELAPINAIPKGYVSDGLIAAADWLVRSIGAQGARVDDVKGLSTDFLPRYLNSSAWGGKFVVGEFFDGNRQLIANWLFNPLGMNGRASAFDFPLKFQLSAMCNNPGRFNMASLDHAGLVGIAPQQAVTFVENHDTDLHPELGTVVSNKLLGYALILTSEGYPCVYYRDYSTDPDCFGLKPQIDNLIWIHEQLARGVTQQRFLSFNIFAYERLAAPNLLVGLNNDPGTEQTIHIQTAFGSNVPLHDYTGHAPDVVTAGDGTATITIPRNNNGLGYVCYSRQNVGEAIRISSHPITQTFFGAEDLDIEPARADRPTALGRIWCAAGTPVRIELRPDLTDFTGDANVTATVIAPDHTRIVTAIATHQRPEVVATVQAKQTGFHEVTVLSTNPPSSNPAPRFELNVTYTAGDLSGEAMLSTAAVELSQTQGNWSKEITLNNVPIHAHLLKDGRVLFWGRRSSKDIGSDVSATLDEHQCQPVLWDPIADPVAQHQTLTPSVPVNLFCSGHTQLPDGRLLVAGGHEFDSQGINTSFIFDPDHDTWTQSGSMNNGRWYPTVVTLSDGTALVSSGSFLDLHATDPNVRTPVNPIQEIWSNGHWQPIVDFQGMPLYPRMHVAPDGRVFMSGPLQQTYLLETSGGGTWTSLGASGNRQAGPRDYAPSVMYDTGKVIYIGGGNNSNTSVPTNAVEIIDLTANPPTWSTVSPMNFRRRQHNATILADGTVLVTGGTSGGGGPGPGFNDLSQGAPVHNAELWDPLSKTWTVMAAESFDRCYHSTALLLPDATVFSGGGGEYRPDNGKPAPNPKKDSLNNAQIFTPPYLHPSRGPRPVIQLAPAAISYGKLFDVTVDNGAAIKKITLIRLGSTTHSFDQNQRINFLLFTLAANTLTVTPPTDPKHCPPGYYMLFVLNGTGQPSKARILRIGLPVPVVADVKVAAPARTAVKLKTLSLTSLNDSLRRKPPGTRVVVGVEPTCPYGISACWGGAFHALKQLSNVAEVAPVPNATDCTAEVYLNNWALPDVSAWAKEFTKFANGSHHFLGAEVTLTGDLIRKDGVILLLSTPNRPQVVLGSLNHVDKVQFDFNQRRPQPTTVAERAAFIDLAHHLTSNDNKLANITVTGPLHQVPGGWELFVRAL